MNAIKAYQSKQTSTDLASIKSDIKSLQSRQEESDKFMKESFKKLENQLLEITSILDNTHRTVSEQSKGISAPLTIPHQSQVYAHAPASAKEPTQPRTGHIYPYRTHKPSVNIKSKAESATRPQYISKCPNLTMLYNHPAKLKPFVFLMQSEKNVNYNHTKGDMNSFCANHRKMYPVSLNENMDQSDGSKLRSTNLKSHSKKTIFIKNCWIWLKMAMNGTINYINTAVTKIIFYTFSSNRMKSN